jgi:Skp family chaperone for outer membrane proteins
MAAGRLFGGLLALLIAVGMTAVGGLAPSAAQQPPPPAPVIIIVDIAQILHDAKAAKDIQSQLDKETAVYSKVVAQQENELQQMRDELERQRTLLAPEAFAAKTREYQQRFETLDHAVQSKRQALQQSLNEAMTKVQNAALEIIQDVAKERKANLVLTKAAVIFEDGSLDVTGEVMSRLDEKLPALVVELPKEAALAPDKPIIDLPASDKPAAGKPKGATPAKN